VPTGAVANNIYSIAGNGNPGAPTGNDGDGGPATAAQLASANWLMVDADGDVLIADTNDDRIRLVAAGQRHNRCSAPGKRWGSSGPQGCARRHMPLRCRTCG
jgi:hypothetical protein